jgi:adenylate cyclase class 2
MIEIERKFRLTNEKRASILKRIESEYGRLLPVHQVDEVFLMGMDSFATYTMGTSIARIRIEDSEAILTYKRQLNKQGDMLEHELKIASTETMRKILLESGYKSVTHVTKTRREAHLDNITLALDEVEELGPFLEIEILAEDEQAIPKAEKQIMAAAVEYGLTEADLEPRKYDQLIAQLTHVY